MNLSILIPVFNEAETIKSVISGLQNELLNLNLTNYEILVINDCSTDATAEILKTIENIKIITQPYNKGYGAALKTGAKQAVYDWLMFYDADGQHKPEYLKDFLPYTQNFDLVSGERIGYKGPWIRQPGKRFINWLVKYLFKIKINDVNCGFRLVKKHEFLRFSHLFPDGFSISTTTVFAFLKEKLNIKFVPLTINKRAGGKSMVKPRQAFVYLMLIFRLVMLFSPLRIFLPVSGFLFGVGLIYLIYDLTMVNISEGTIFILITSILIFLFGLIADQIAALRREISLKN
ncbi:MAG TPA: glycosyltransferase family 2 protein [bacterium]|nr:glycosyltransferase family 2 protein [bacterium]